VTRVSADSSGSERVLELAKAYPYAAPASSFVLIGDRVHELRRPRTAPAEGLAGVVALDPGGGDERPLAELDPRLAPESLKDRLPLLAYGANRSPEALARKRALPGFPADEPIVGVRARLHGLDVVYSAHLTRYGAVAATLQRSPGASVDLIVLLVTGAQLEAITATEDRNYTLEALWALELELEVGGSADRVLTYVSRHGCLRVDGSERALAAIPAERRRLAPITEPEALAVAARRLGHGGSLDDFVLATARDSELATARTRALRRDALPLVWPHRHLWRRAGVPRHGERADRGPGPSGSTGRPCGPGTGPPA
jgi:hypothetical protein